MKPIYVARGSSGETGPINPPLWVSMLIAGFFAISIYNVIEIFIGIFHTFRRRRGLYFWSMFVTNCGILVHTISVFLRFYSLAPHLPMSVIICLGWWAMVTGSSVVLYSRLHLVVYDPRKIRLVLVMIITSFCVFHVPVTILFIGSNSADPSRFIDTFNVYERIQLVGFSIQESTISAIYIWQAHVNLRPLLRLKGSNGKYLMRHLIILFIVVFVLDVSLILSQFTNHFDIQTTYKPVVYSVKLKVEFFVLNEIVAITQVTTCPCYYQVNSTKESSDPQPCASGAIPVNTGSRLELAPGTESSQLKSEKSTETQYN
jgi:hypothetical protein